MSLDRRYSVAALLAVGLVVLAAVRRPLAGPQRLELGGPADAAYLDGEWSGGFRLDVDPPAASDQVLSFYCRAAHPGATVVFPFEARGTVALTLRAKALVRSVASLVVERQPAGQVLVSTERWERLPMALTKLDGQALRLELVLRPLVRTRGEHAANPEILIDWVELQASGGLRLSLAASLLLAAVPLLFGLGALFVGCGGRSTGWFGLTAGAATLAAARLCPLVAVAAAPRLVPLALAAGLLAFLALRWASIAAGDRRALAGLVVLGTLLHGLLVFLPNHNPPDLATHVDRALDLARVPLEYQALLRYGSHLPTASQKSAPATDLFGQGALVPYSPLPYFVYYGLAQLGLDLRWLITALGAAMAMGVMVALWLAARSVWDRPTAWLAAGLYTLDLAVWHHLGRAHAPASFGQALATTALLFWLANAERIDRPRRILGAAVLLCLAVLGYTSLAILVGLFGLVLLALLLLDARSFSPAARRGAALSLVLGGLMALAVYYGHYLPGFLHQGGPQTVEAEPERFTGKVVLGLFRNEGRQSYRIWAMGFALPLIAGLAAAPLALRRCRAAARPTLYAWFGGWALLMLLKDPLFFPKTLRWAKEDQFLSPLLCLWIAAGAWALPRAWMRILASGLWLAVAFWLQQRDFLLHANTLLW